MGKKARRVETDEEDEQPSRKEPIKDAKKGGKKAPPPISDSDDSDSISEEKPKIIKKA